ncbi:MAG: Maf family protein [Anaerolineae bacterium]
MLLAATRGITLASASPRRSLLLAVLGIPFTISPVDILEERLPGESPQAMVVRLSVAKARAAVPGSAHTIVLGSDTAVIMASGGETLVIGKPVDRQQVREMLALLGGRTHVVYTGFALLDTCSGRMITGWQTVTVCLRSLTEGELFAYIDSGIGDDKAGAYAIQDQRFRLVERLSGCVAAAMGLPLCALWKALPRLGIVVPAKEAVIEGCQALTGLACCLESSDECPELVING